jgi:hypothetical protein
MPDELIPFDQLVKRRGTDALRQQEIPDTHAIALGLPTMRAQHPGYAFFAAPALRVPGRPQVQDAPDRWWVISAENGKLLLYALQDVFPFSGDASKRREELTPPNCTLEEFKGRLGRLRVLVDAAAPKFFRGEAVSKEARGRILELLEQVIPEQLHEHYRALVPDFYTWLEA